MKLPFKFDFDPLNFAFIMATEGISYVLQLMEYPLLSLGFFFFGILAYLSLLIQFFLNLWSDPRIIRDQLLDVPTQFKYLTFSAGTNALATRLTLAHLDELAFILACVGTISAIILIYSIFTILFFKKEPHSISNISPLWLLISIAAHGTGIAILALWNHGYLLNPLFIVLAVIFWSFGVLIYFFFMTLNLYRMFFLPFTANDLNPAYWTCMGAAAIGAVDGGQLALVPHELDFLKVMTPFIQGMVVMLWAFGTAWIPLLCIELFYRHIQSKIPFVYHPSLWAIVFPLGMYTESTYLIGSSAHLHEVQWMAIYWLWIAVGSWIVILSLRIKKIFEF